MRVLVTGGAGFIGSTFVRTIFRKQPNPEVFVLDALTYAGNLDNLATVQSLPGFRFERADIRDLPIVRGVFERFRPEVVVHFAAESHVDRSILRPARCVSTNVMGTTALLEAAREFPPGVVVHVSTDEVYGTVDKPFFANEHYPLAPSNPYSASKAGSDLLALSYGRTFSIPIIVTRSSNNYGPYQFPEKLIPLMIARALDNSSLPLYGDGQQTRDWLHVDDHCEAIISLIKCGRPGEIYNISGRRHVPNIDVVRMILEYCERPTSLIHHVPDRPAHDRRYAMDSSKLEAETGWSPQVGFEYGLKETVRWYSENLDWVSRVRTGEYHRYYERNYGHRRKISGP